MRPQRAALVAALLGLAARSRGEEPRGGAFAGRVVGQDEDGRRDDTAPLLRIKPAEEGRFSRSVADSLRGSVGVQLRSGGLSQYSAALLRGAAPQQVAVFLDGVPLNRGGQAAVDLSQLAVEDIAAIDVYRGLPPLWVDCDALGGAILLTSRGARAAAPEAAGGGERPLRGRAAAGGGSFGVRNLSAGLATASPAPLSASLSVAYQGADGDYPYYYTNGFVYDLSQHGELRRRNDDFDQLTVDAQVRRRFQRWSAALLAHGYFKHQGVAGIGQPGAQVGRPTLSNAWAMLTAQAGGPVGERLTLDLQAYGNLPWTLYQSLEEQPPSRFEQLGAQAGVSALARLRVLQTPRWQVLLLGRAEGRAELQRSADLCPAPRRDCVPASLSQRLRASAALGAELRLWGDQLLLQPGAQLLASRSQLAPVGAAGLVGQDLFLSPRLGLRLYLWRPPAAAGEGVFLRGSGGRLARLPTFLELFGDRAFFRENLQLRPEQAWLAEGGLGLALTRAALRIEGEVNGFYRVVNDEIETVRDGPGLRARNFERVRQAGAEAALTVLMKDIAELRVNYTFVDAHDFTGIPGRDGDLLPGRPRHALFVRAVAGPRRWLRAFYELDYASTLYLDAANLQPRPPRALHGLGVILGPRRLEAGGEAEVLFEARNLLDTRTVDVPLSLTSDGRPARSALVDYYDYPLPGRALFASMRVTF